MRNGTFINIVTKMQNSPRWDEYAPKFSDNTSSHSYRVAVYALMAALLEKERHGQDIDVLKVVCRAVFHDINEYITGPITHQTKKDPEVKREIVELEKEASGRICDLLSRSLQPIFEDFIVHAEDDTLEGRIVDAMDTFDALMFCKRETVFGSTYFFPEKYEELAAELREHPLESVRWMVEQVDKETDVYDFLFGVMMLDRVRRWKGRFNMTHDDDAIHGFRVAALAIFNGYIEKVKYGKEIDILKFVSRALCHDLAEQETGDVLGPVKYSSQERKIAFSRYEKKVSLYLVDKLPDELKPVFTDAMVHAKDRSYEGMLVDAADKIDALIKANMERKSNKLEAYEDSYRNQRILIQNTYENPSTIFFLAYILHDLHDMVVEEI